MRPLVLLATASSLPALDEDDRPLVPALAARGFDARAAVWDDPAVEWAAAALCVIRSTWDYTTRREEFVAWCERAGRVTQLCNPARGIAWNTHKGYLVELAERGVPVVPTRLLRRGDPPRLDPFGKADESRVVIKPAVSAGARGALSVALSDPVERAAGEAHLGALLAEGDALVQPFQAAADGHGERSLLFFDGRFSHAMRKPSLLGCDAGQRADPRIVLAPASGAEIAAAEAVLGATHALLGLSEPLLYARVDLVPDASGAPVLMELEMTEPRLFLADAEGSYVRLAEAIGRRVRRS